MIFSGYKEQLRRGGGALIVNRDNDVLLLLRSAGARNDKGLWSQPGGAIDGDATPVEAVRREILEEIGATIRIQRFLTTTSHYDEDCQWLAYSYLGHLEEEAARCCEPDKHDSLCWFPLAALPANLNQVTREAVQVYQSYTTPGPAHCSKLVVFDMDGTLLPGTTANLELARVLGQESMVRGLETAYHAGMLDNHRYAECILAMYTLLRPDHVEEAFANAPKLQGLEDLIIWAKVHGIRIAVLTTGPEFFARKFIELYGFDDVAGSLFPVHEGEIKLGACRVIRDADKPVHATSLCQRMKIDVRSCVALGDSRSDLALFRSFPNSIALNYHPVLAGEAKHYLRTRFAPDLIPALASMLYL
jgi:phosphoserine phosphatase